ncbi:MAG: exodeoxyribonuclease V subunit gamma [Proteobacteria bacterium]|nr:exodeoxyribonuclease V subunit gamma [Pseudomonadota bacterium]
MGSIQLLLGKSRRRRRRALPAEALSGIDPHGRPTFLYVTDTQRKAAVVEREFLEYRREAPVFAPEVRVLSDVLTDLWARHGTGKAILSRKACALAAERLLTEQADAFPWLSSLGRRSAVGAALADLLRTASEARRTKLGAFPRADELHRALQALTRRLDRVPGHIREAAALEALLALLDAPPPALTEWLRSTHSVVLDDILMPSPLRRALLVALCRAWDTVGTHVVVAFETGRDLGGREAGLFFGYDDVDDVAYPLKPFAATRALRRELFDNLVAEGDGEILVGLDEGVLRLEPADVPETVEALDLSDWIYASAPCPVEDEAAARALLDDTVSLVRCADAESELQFIARGVKQALLDGARPGDCVVALPDLSTYGPALKAVFDDHGIPYSLSAGSRLAHSPVANTLRRLTTVALHGWRVDELLPLLRSDLIATPEGLDCARLLSWCRAAGISGGEPETWLSAIGQWIGREGRRSKVTTAEAKEAIDAVVTAILPLRMMLAPATPEDWAERLIEVSGLFDFTERIATCAEAPEVAADNLFAWGAALRTLETLVRDLQIVDTGPWTAEALAENFDRVLHEATYTSGRHSMAQVQVVGVLELRGLTPKHTWLGGLARGTFPAGTRKPFLVPSQVQRTLEPIDRLAEARYLFCSLIRNALDDPNMQSLTLSWPTTLRGRTVPPAPVLADLLAVPTTTSGKLLGDWLVDTPRPPDKPLATSDLLRGAAQEPAWLNLAGDLGPTLARQSSDHAERQAEVFGRFDAVLDNPSPRPKTLSVSQLDTYVKCPMRFWLRKDLGLTEEEEWDPELGPQRRGIALHDILQHFVEAFRELHPDEPLTDQDADALRPILKRIAEEVIAKVKEKKGFDEALFEHDRRVWTSGLDGVGPRGVLPEWLNSEIRDFTRGRPMSIEDEYSIQLGETRIKARIDRVDRVNQAGGGLLVLDYKTGGWPKKGLLLRGLAMQPVLYAAAIGQEHPGEPVVTAWSLVGRPNEIKRKGFVGPQRMLKGLYKERWGEVMEASDLDELVQFAEVAVDHIAEGLFHTTTAEPRDANCRTCDFRRICRLDEERSLRILESGTHCHAPRRPEEGGET